MRFVMFYHSLISDWNHGNAHFLRGVVRELMELGHTVQVYEPVNAWSVQNLVSDQGEGVLREFESAYPGLSSCRYEPANLDLDEALNLADVVIVHEWNDPDLVRRIGKHHTSRRCYRLYFHDTHHRAVTSPKEIASYDLSGYDGVLAFGRVLRDLYLARGWAADAWVWHEAADVRVFHPVPDQPSEGDLVWVGNWGDEERTRELHEFLLEPVRGLGLEARVYGVRYPEHAVKALAAAGIEYGGWLANYRVPDVFSRFKVTVHVPRRPYVEALPGIPTIRVFEALACGIPLVCSPWNDAEHLFSPGEDYLVAQDGAEMRRHLRAICNDRPLAASLREHGLTTILARHTCAHRARELLAIVNQQEESSWQNHSASRSSAQASYLPTGTERPPITAA